MVPNREKDSSLLLGYSISFEEYNLTGFNHQKNATLMGLGFRAPGSSLAFQFILDTKPFRV